MIYEVLDLLSSDPHFCMFGILINPPAMENCSSLAFYLYFFKPTCLPHFSISLQSLPGADVESSSVSCSVKVTDGCFLLATTSTKFASVDFAFIVVAVVEFADKAGVAVSTLFTITVFVLIQALRNFN